MKYGTKALGVSKEDLVEAIEKVGNAAATVRNELRRRQLAMINNNKPLEPDDFAVNVEGNKIIKQDGAPTVEAEHPAVAADVADRLNEDEARREEDKWSA